MRVLVWQWGRRGAGPRIAMELARGFDGVPGVHPLLSLSEGAELLRQDDAPDCALKMPTYASVRGFMARSLATPVLVPRLARWVRAQQLDVAVCAMPAPMDFVMAGALRLARRPYAVVVHDAELHPGDVFPLQMKLQRALLRGAAGLFALTEHVAERLRQQGLGGKLLLAASLPPLAYGPPRPPPLAHGGKLRLLSFGRLLPYKGLDLLADGLAMLGARPEIEVRVVGQGPESAELNRLRTLDFVTVENRWVPEAEVGSLLAWADAVILSHREASQSGVAAAALATGRWVIATRVGGLVEQLRDEPLALFCDPAPDSIAASVRTLLAGGYGFRAAPPDPGAAWIALAGQLAGGLRALVEHRGGAAGVARGGVDAPLKSAADEK